MRLTGSSQTIVTQGVSAMICSIGRSATAVPPAGTTVSVPDITFIVAILEPGGRPPGTPAGRAKPNLPEKPRPEPGGRPPGTPAGRAEPNLPEKPRPEPGGRPPGTPAGRAEPNQPEKPRPEPRGATPWNPRRACRAQSAGE